MTAPTKIVGNSAYKKQHAEMLSNILNRVAEVTGVDFNEYRSATLLRHAEKRMYLSGAPSLEDYYQFLLDNKQECGNLSKEILFGGTRFFKDKDAFELLKKKALQEILLNKGSQKEIRVWVPGCATGEEAYSIAIALEECLEELELRRIFKIFATDVDKESINFAAEGAYPQNIADDLGPNQLSKYFQLRRNRYHVKNNLRERVIFAVHDALQDPPFIHIDLISCRNLAIFLDRQAQQNLFRNFQISLNYNAYLFLGPGETVGASRKAFALVDARWKIYKNISTPMKHRPASRPHFLGQGPHQTEEVPPEYDLAVRLNALEIELQKVMLENQNIIEQLTTLQKELRSAHAAIQLLNEELRSTKSRLQEKIAGPSGLQPES